MVEPGQEFEHDIPPAQLASHLRSGFICAVPTLLAPGEVVLNAAQQLPREIRRPSDGE